MAGVIASANKMYQATLGGVDWKKNEARIRNLVTKQPMVAAGFVLGILILINLIGLSGSKSSGMIEQAHEVNFQNGRIINDRESTFYHGQERLLSQKAQTLIESQQKLEARLIELEKRLQSEGAAKAAPVGGEAGANEARQNGPTGAGGIEAYAPGGDFEGSSPSVESQARPPARRSRALSTPAGPDLIAFPVKGDSKPPGLVLPSGSYVKAKILTGVEVPEGKTYPVLLVLDFSYVAPNDHKIDLSGCFMIAKAEGDLSTERVQMQATKMSCVSKRGKMFEREVNGFIADDKDGSFAMKGKVNSKQGRVAAMAFLASVVDGVGKAVQQSQTTQTTNALGGSQSVMTGDTAKYVVAGGASNAAGMVAQWYLQQAQNLAPTVAVGSGRDVWIVMKDKVSLPDEFFKKERKENDENIYSYVTRIVD